MRGASTTEAVDSEVTGTAESGETTERLPLGGNSLAHKK